MTDWAVPATMIPSLIIGPILVGRLFPQSTGCSGTPAEGRCGMSPLIWGLALGLIVPAPILMSLPPPTGVHRTLANDLMLVLLLTLFTAPLIAWGCERWSWDRTRIVRKNLFGERKLEWGAITHLARRGRGFQLNTADNSISVDEFVSGMPLIFAAAAHYRPKLAREAPKPTD